MSAQQKENLLCYNGFVMVVTTPQAVTATETRVLCNCSCASTADRDAAAFMNNYKGKKERLRRKAAQSNQKKYQKPLLSSSCGSIRVPPAFLGDLCRLGTTEKGACFKAIGQIDSQ